MLRALVDELHGRTDHGVTFGLIPGLLAGFVAIKPGAQYRDEQHVEEPIQHGRLTGSITGHLVVEHGHER